MPPRERQRSSKRRATSQDKQSVPELSSDGRNSSGKRSFLAGRHQGLHRLSHLCRPQHGNPLRCGHLSRVPPGLAPADPFGGRQQVRQLEQLPQRQLWRQFFVQQHSFVMLSLPHQQRSPRAADNHQGARRPDDILRQLSRRRQIALSPTATPGEGRKDASGLLPSQPTPQHTKKFSPPLDSPLLLGIIPTCN